MTKKVKLPCSECKGMCCTYPVFTQEEFNKLRFHIGKMPIETKVTPTERLVTYDPKINSGSLGYVIHLDSGVCPFLKETGCSIPDLKPKVCQDYGVVEALPCEYLYPKQAEKKQKDRMRRSIAQ